MPRQTILGSLVLFAITAVAILCHSVSHNLESGEPKSTVYGLRSMLYNPSPEQKYLINGPIDINKATIEDLDAIPHVGQALANRIIAFRTESGTFKNLDELLEVKGIGPRILEELKPYLK